MGEIFGSVMSDRDKWERLGVDVEEEFDGDGDYLRLRFFAYDDDFDYADNEILIGLKDGKIVVEYDDDSGNSDRLELTVKPSKLITAIP